MTNYQITTSDKLAVLAGKVSAATIRLLGAGMGTNLPGRFARRLSPRILADLSSQPRMGSVAVTGTNGKSTTAGLISAILRTAGYKLVHNRQGANLVTGITASLVDAADWSGQIDADFGVFEIDEAALPVVAREIPLKTILVTNLFRDQLDRFGELDTTARLIETGIQINNSWAVLNADDPNVCQLISSGERTYYGVGSIESCAITEYEPAELAYCSKCGAEIEYASKSYGQLGCWHCSKCDHKRPELDCYATNIRTLASTSIFDLHWQGESLEIELNLPGLFNVYNAVAACALALKLGISLPAVKDGLKEYTTLFGRSEKITLNGKSAIIQLIKNPAGASQTIQALVNEPKLQVLIAINDNYADGRDVSWLWDADFEPLATLSCKFIVSGHRAEDMAVRLKYAGVDEKQIECVPPLAKALEKAFENCSAGETLWILPTYTCLLDLQKILKRLGLTLKDSL
jgi:lipid II isoglutaminyl synthase (glutamine-hydrolysing)